MALIDEVQNRYSTARLVALTNPDAETVTTLDVTPTGKLALAVADVEGDFKIYVNAIYDNTNQMHVNVATEGVVIKLMLRGFNVPEDAYQLHRDWIERCRALARVTARDRIPPKSTSTKVPLPEVPNQPPDFDNRTFEDLIPDPPRVSRDINDPLP